jgi:UDPglucose 6-dehydrogenase
VRIHVLGDGVLAATVRQCAKPFHDFTDTTPDVLWVCNDTPISDGRGEPKYVRYAIDRVIDEIDPHLTLISSQVPVGFCAQMERLHRKRRFAVSPENIRVATPVEDFMGQTRVVVGARRQHPELVELFRPFCPSIHWMTPESAEMVKLALNTYLAMCVRFGNEVGAMCDTVGADSGHVFTALRAERRVSPNAPLLPGSPPSQHLLRDVNVLAALGTGPLVRSLLEAK